MKNEVIEKLPSLTREEKMDGIYLSNDGEIYLGSNSMPENFSGEYKEWWDNRQLFQHIYFKNG